MKKNLTVIKSVGVYALLKWGNQYVVAWQYEHDTQEWGQGHYFDNELVAKQVFDDKIRAYYG